MNLDEKIKRYFELKDEIAVLETEKDQLSESIKAMIGVFPDQAYTTPDGYSAKLIEKTTYKYNDETAIIKYLNDKNLADTYMVKKFDTTKINKELKNHGILFNDLKEYISEVLTESLTVKVEDK